MNTKNWKEFRVDKLFDYERGKESAPNQNLSGDCKLISEISDNNGFVRFVKPTKTIKGHCLTVSVNFADIVFYQEDDFCASVNIMILRPKFELSKNQLLFIASVMSKQHSIYSYTDKISKALLMEEYILLPAIDPDTPDFDYMEEYIEEIKIKYINDLAKDNNLKINKALEITGLSYKDLDQELVVRPARRYEEFRVGDLFKVKSSNKIYHANQVIIKDEKTDNTHPYVVRTENNRGVRGYINESEKNLNNGMTLSFAQDTFISFFQPIDYFTGNKVKILKPKYDMNKNVFLYLETAINKAVKAFTWGASSTEDSIRDTKILLPAIDKDTPDFDYMEKTIYIYIAKKIKLEKLSNEKEIKLLRSII